MHSVVVVPPGEGRGNGHRTLFGVRLPAFGFRTCWTPLPSQVSGAGLTDLKARAPEPFTACGGCRVTSGWAPDRLLPRLHCFRPIPVRRRAFFVAWDCKVTPADCACQERNTTGCIPNNDGLGAGLEPGFPHCGKNRDSGELLSVGMDSLFGTVSHGRSWACRGLKNGSGVPSARCSIV
jgi:hypothetical protein